VWVQLVKEVNMGLFGTKKAKEITAKDCVGMVQDFLIKVGLDPNGQRIEDEDTLGWWVLRGSAVVYIILNDLDNDCSIRIVSPIVYLPEESILPFYRKCLEINMGLLNCSLAVSGDKVYVVHERPITGLDAEEFEGTLGFLAAVADDLDNKLADEFGAKIYSEALEQG
jgi:hypothetical protein